MAKPVFLTIDVKSEHIENGLGYMVGFTLPEGTFATPAQTPGFDEWSQKVRDAVTRTGDQPFNPDPYTKKLALAELMDEFERLNGLFPVFQIGRLEDAPALQIHSSNPFDKKISVDFSDKEGHISITETPSALLPKARIDEPGRIGLTENPEKGFPFKKSPPSFPTPPAARARQLSP